MGKTGNSIGIIGMGWVGSSVAISLLQNGIAKELFLHDAREGIAEGEAMDLNHGSGFYPAAEVKAARIDEMHACDVVVVTAGRGGKPGESRLDLLKENIGIVRDISAQLKGFTGILVVVANPVDVLTYFYQHYTGLPASHVIGTGTFLDTARLRDMVGETLGIEAKSVHADVLGEHGDSAVMLWSGASIGGVPLRDWEGWNQESEQELSRKVTGAAQEIIRRKGATNHAIGLVTAFLCKFLLRDDKRVVCVSTVLDGPYGLSKVALSLPCVLSEKGVVQVLEPKLDAAEFEALMESAAVIRKAIEEVV